MLDTIVLISTSSIKMMHWTCLVRDGYKDPLYICVVLPR